MKTTQITHNDLDGYGASTVVGVTIAVARVIHIARYRDVAGVLNAEISRLEASEEAERLIITDIAIEAPTAEAILRFSRMNAERPGREHRLIVLDHHVSSVTALTARGCHALPDREPAYPQACYYTVPGQDYGDASRPGDDPIVVLIDDSRCATKIAYDHRDLYPGEEPDPTYYVSLPFLGRLVEAVDAIDLWKTDRSVFPCACAINDGFWASVGTFIPDGHPAHDRFVSEFLLELAPLMANTVPWIIEQAVPTARRSVITLLIASAGIEETAQETLETTPVRAARLVARTAAGLFVDIPHPTGTVKLAYAMDAGVFQRVSDIMLGEGQASLVINVLRGGQMSLRSRDGSAIAVASKLGGGGHANASGASLPTTGVFSIEDARSRFTAAIAKVLD